MNQESTETQQTAESAVPEEKPEATREGAETADELFTVNDRRFWARDAADEASEPKKPSYVEELEGKLAEKEQRLQATLAQYKEALDEFEAAKARLRRDIGKEIEAGKRAILVDLLDVVDNLERAIEAGGNVESNPMLSGVSMVRDQFLAKLENLGVKRLEALGQVFDPARFEAVSMVPVEDAAQDGKVVGVVRSCYTIGEETLRYGMVAVGKAEPQKKA